MGVVWGNLSGSVDFAAGLTRELDARFVGNDAGDKAMLVHIDLDVLDISLGKANAFASPGGLLEEDMMACLRAVSERTTPLALTVASFDPR